MRYLYNILSTNYGIIPKYNITTNDNNVNDNIFLINVIIIILIIMLYLIFIFEEKEIKLLIS
jgi:hypothetical protein